MAKRIESTAGVLPANCFFFFFQYLFSATHSYSEHKFAERLTKMVVFLFTLSEPEVRFYCFDCALTTFVVVFMFFMFFLYYYFDDQSSEAKVHPTYFLVFFFLKGGKCVKNEVSLSIRTFIFFEPVTPLFSISLHSPGNMTIGQSISRERLRFIL